MLWWIKRRSAHSYDLQQMDQCVSQTYNLRKLASGQHDLEARGTPQGLPPGESLSIPLDFTGAGTIQLIIRADVSSDVPVQLAVSNAQGREIWATQPSTRIADAYVVDLEAPGAYILAVKNPRSNTANASFIGLLNVTMCGEPAVEFWLKQYVKLRRISSYAPFANIDIPVAPMGIAVYGVKKDGGRYTTYKLTTDAVRGEIDIPPDISVTSYEFGGSPSGRAFSVQLNAYIVVRLKNRETQYYWIQNTIGFYENKSNTEFYIFFDKNIKTPLVTINGKGIGLPYYVDRIQDSISFGHVELGIRTYVKKGKIIVGFYVNGREYEELMENLKAPADSAHIEIAPTTTPTGDALDLELVFAGYKGDIPWAVLNAGRIGLKLYVNKNGKWVPPPSAWSVGYATLEASYARVEPQGVGSVLVVPGEPNLQQLWSSPDFDPP